MYFNKFSSGTLLALLALSGMLFLVPAVVPVHAAGNASLPTYTAGLTVLQGGVATGDPFTLTNPASNAYAITSVTYVAPTGWTFAANACGGGLLNVLAASSATAFQCTGTLPPGFSTAGAGSTITPVASPATSPAPTGVITTSVTDASSTGAYSGPTLTLYSIAAPTIAVLPGATAFTAGGSPVTITANDGTSQAGVPFTFSITAGGYPHAGYTASVSPVTVFTGSNGKASSTFTPSNWATDSTTITATAGVFSAASGAITTSAGSPASVGWTITAGSLNAGKTMYLTGAGFFGTPTVIPSLGTLGELPVASALTVAVTDAFNNPIAFGAITGAAITIASPAGTGFDNGGAALLTTITCLVPAGAVNCATGAVTLNYFQGYTYGTIGSLSAVITGEYPGVTAFSVSSTSGIISTGTQSGPYTLVVTGTSGAGTADKITASPTGGSQPGVPVTFNLCGQQVGRTVCAGTNVGYGGSFVGGGQIGFVVSTSGASGTAVASYNVDNTLGHVPTWNATEPAPTYAAPKTVLSSVAVAGPATVPGAPANFKALVYFSDQITSVGKSIVAGQQMYVNVELVDAYGNLAVNTLVNQIQINLAATLPTTLSVQAAYIQFGNSQTLPVLGWIQWTVPTGIVTDTVLTLTMSGVVNGLAVAPTFSTTVVSPTPTFNVKSPTPSNGYIYSSATGVTFKGWANASLGYNPANTGIATIGYKVGSSPWVQTAGSGTATDNYVLSLFMPVGLSTIMFNATDNTAAKNTVVSSSYTVLVDTAAPTFTFPSATSTTGCTTVTAATAEGDFNTATTGTNAFTATFGGVAVPAASISFSGSQTPGTAGSVTATICGLTTQTATLSVTGYTLAGLSSTNSESLTVTVPFANSITFNTATATYGLVGAFKGVTISVTNSWNTAQTIVVYATLKSGTSTYVADGTVTVGAGATASVFCVDLLAIPAGSYSVTFAAVTTSNQAVSAPTTPITLTAT